jgi:hypothetical protein
MRLKLAAAFLLLATSFSLAADDGFTALWNGKDLTGWKTYLKETKGSPKPDPKQVWQFQDGVIICSGKPNGYIMTEKEYSNYVFKMKWRFPADSKGGNSGVLLHCVGNDKIWPLCYEAQLKSGTAGDIWLMADDAGKYPAIDVAADRKDAANKEGRHFFRIGKDEAIEKKFGEWNEYEITCNDGSITMVINGKKVNEAKNAAIKKGRIAIQSEGAEIHFKDIVIKEMK